MRVRTMLAVAAIAAGTTGCMTYPAGSVAPDTGMINPNARAEIRGSVTYRERMMAPPGSVVTVQLQNVSLADAPARTIAEQRIPLDGRSVPVDYVLTPYAVDLQPNMRYAVRAEIRSEGGALMWTSDTYNPINPTVAGQTLPMIVMVKVDSDRGPAMNPLLDQSWRVTSIDGQPVIDSGKAFIRFGSDGQVTGKTGCNSFGGSYRDSGGAIAMGPTIVTQMACMPPLMDQETRFLAVASKIVRYTANPDGSVTFFTATGASMRGER